MKVLVCGGAGYIGSHAVVELLDRGYEVVIIDNLSTGHKELIDKRAVFYKQDIRDEDGLNELFEKEKIDIVMHFAASLVVPESVEKPLEYYENNFYGTVSLLKTMQKNNMKKIIFSSTAATYGNPEQVPVTEKTNQNPINPYGMSKFFVEKLLEDCRKSYGINYVIFRYFNVSGAHEKYPLGQINDNFTHLIPVILEVASGKRDHIKIFGTDYDTKDGTCIRDYIHVVDLVNAHILAIEKLCEESNTSTSCDCEEQSDVAISDNLKSSILNLKSNGFVYNLGNGKGFTVKEMIEAAKKVTGKEIKVIESDRRQGDPAELIADSTKARAELGWEPNYKDVESIIKTAWEWHKKELNL